MENTTRNGWVWVPSGPISGVRWVAANAPRLGFMAWVATMILLKTGGMLG